MQRFGTVLTLFALAISFVSAQEASTIRFSVQPSYSVPIGPGLDSNGGQPPYSAGLGATVSGDFSLNDSGSLFARGLMGYTYLPVIDGALGITDDLSLISLGAGGGVRLPIIPQSLTVAFSAAGGVYQGLMGDEAAANLYAQSGAQLALRLSPGFTLSAGADYSRYFAPASANLPGYLYDGIAVQIGGSISLNGGQRKSRIEVIDIQIDPIFPILHSYYDTNQIGSVTLKNTENRAIENIRVSLLIPQYMDRPKSSPAVERVAKGETIEVPLYALLTDEVLEVTEDGKRVSAQITVEYSLGSEKLTATDDQSALVQNRNALTWTDDRKAAAFVTAKDNTVLRLAKQTAGAVREENSRPLDGNFRKALGIYETLGLLQMQYVVDPDSSYIELSRNAAAQDYVQFPAQTLDYRAGDCDDLSILYTALLEAVNVETAFITVPGHIYTAFALELTPQEAKRTFSDPERLIFMNDKAWVPVEATVMNAGFQRAWDEGVRQWQEYNSDGRAGFHPVRQAWQEYQAVASPLTAPEIEIPDQAQIARSYGSALEAVVQREISSQVARIEAQIQASGGNTAFANRLGVLYARYGLYDRAMEEFIPLVEQQNYGPAMVNAANIYFLRQEYASSLRYYSMAADTLVDATRAKLGIARAQYQLENYAAAKQSYADVAAADPELAQRFAHLGSTSSGGARASSAANRGLAVWEE